MATVYLVTSGSYSDYGVNAIFESKDDAQKFCDLQNASDDTYDKLGIEEWEMYPAGVTINVRYSAHITLYPDDGRRITMQHSKSQESVTEPVVASVKLIPASQVAREHYSMLGTIEIVASSIVERDRLTKESVAKAMGEWK